MHSAAAMRIAMVANCIMEIERESQTAIIAGESFHLGFRNHQDEISAEFFSSLAVRSRLPLGNSLQHARMQFLHVEPSSL